MIQENPDLIGDELNLGSKASPAKRDKISSLGRKLRFLREEDIIT